MEPLHSTKTRRSARFAGMLAGTATALLLAAVAQAQEIKPSAPPREPEQVQTFFLKNITSINQLNDVQTDLRNALSRARIYGIQTENAITVRATADELETARKLIADLDRPQKLYRITYTITEIDAGKRLGTHSVSVVVPEFGKGVIKQGNRVPLVTGSTGTGSDLTSQVQYIDVGLNLETTAYDAQLRTKIEQTSVADDKSSVGTQDPVIRQTMLDGTSPLTAGKSVVLGSIDVPGSARQQQISVTTELLPRQD